MSWLGLSLQNGKDVLICPHPDVPIGVSAIFLRRGSETFMNCCEFRGLSTWSTQCLSNCVSAHKNAATQVRQFIEGCLSRRFVIAQQSSCCFEFVNPMLEACASTLTSTYYIRLCPTCITCSSRSSQWPQRLCWTKTGCEEDGVRIRDTRKHHL